MRTIIYIAFFLVIVIGFSPYSSPWGFILTILRAHGGPLTLKRGFLQSNA